MQRVMTYDACHDCGQVIKPSEPFYQTAQVDYLESGRTYSTRPTTHHLRRMCPKGPGQDKTS